MFKRIFNTSSPVGIALAVAGVVLALSPEARKATRRLLVKGTAAILGVTDQIKSMATDGTQAPSQVNPIPYTQTIGTQEPDEHPVH